LTNETAAQTKTPFGNRSVSSKSGSADVLEKLGVSIQATPDSVKRSIEMKQMGCLATLAPAAEAVIAAAVDMLNVEIPSPPVPHVSTTSVKPPDVCARARITFTNPASSSAVSPRWANTDKIPPISDCDMSPFIIISISFSASPVFSVSRKPNMKRAVTKRGRF
jgi:hypothetical protein